LNKIPTSNQKINWARFAGLASQWAIALFILLFLGKYLDGFHLIHAKFPLFIWFLPFLFIIISLFRIIKETNLKDNNQKK
jgi:hypothetical protein